MLNWYVGEQFPSDIPYSGLVTTTKGVELLGAELSVVGEFAAGILEEVVVTSAALRSMDSDALKALDAAGASPVAGTTGKAFLTFEDGHNQVNLIVCVPKDTAIEDMQGLVVYSSVGADPAAPDERYVLGVLPLLEGSVKVVSNPHPNGTTFWIKWNPYRETLESNLQEVQRNITEV